MHGVDPSGAITLFEILGVIANKINLRNTQAGNVYRQSRQIAASLCRISAVFAKQFNDFYVYALRYGEVTRLTNGSGFQAHHVFQNAAMKTLFEGLYEKSVGFAIPLLGGSRKPGTPHDMANLRQGALRHYKLLNPRYVAYEALLAAGCRRSDATELVQMAERFNNFYGWK